MGQLRIPARAKSTTPNPLRPGAVLQGVKIPSHLDGHRINNRPALVALLRLVGSFADHDTGRESRASLQTLAEAIQASIRTIQRGLLLLERLGLLVRTRAHSWRLHRPVTWAIAPDALRTARLEAVQKIRERSSRYWEQVRAWAREHYRRCPVSSGGQVCHQPSPLQGERGKEGQEEGSIAPPGSLLDILQNLQKRNRGIPAT